MGWIIGNLIGFVISTTINLWVKLLGKKVKLADAEWLAGPIGTPEKIGADYYQNLITNLNLTAQINSPNTGLMENFNDLHSASFNAAAIDPPVKDFYERTVNYRLDVWSQWSGLFRPFGWLLVAAVSRRIQQLNLPISPLDTSRGMSSDVIKLIDNKTTETRYTCWLRKVVATNDVVYAGFYSVCQPPNYPGPCVKVVFPLPQGSSTVVLKPELQPDGSLILTSSGTGVGDTGFYRLIKIDDETVKVRYIRAMKETIHVYRDQQGTLRTDHIFRFFRIVILRLHYKINLKDSQTVAELQVN